MIRDNSIGDKELELLRVIADGGPVTVSQAMDQFGEPRKLARSTVLTMMERLRKKGRLERAQVEGVYRYSSPVPSSLVLQDVVRSFVQRTLAGSVSPFVTYLTEQEAVSSDELVELQELVTRLQAKRHDG